jgi:tyrosine-protein kinase Etk/Wzc
VQQSTGVLHLEMEAKAMIEAVANAKATLAMKQIQMQGLLASEQPQAPNVVRLQREIDALRAQVSQLEGKGGGASGSTGALATAGLEYARRYREVKFQETLLELLFKQYEAARLDETRNSVVIQTLDPAIPPELRTWPKRTLIVLAAFGLSLALAVAAAFAYEAMIRLVQKPEIAARMALIRQYFAPPYRV